jgi:CBS domain-containing protein
MKVKDAMHAGVVWVGPDEPLSDVARKMRDNDIGAIPVGENDRLVGMVTDRDICCRAVAADKQISELTARDVMSQGIVYCQEAEEVESAVRIMESRQIRRLPVINAEKRMVGMLSLGDVCHSCSRELSGEVMSGVAAHHA